MFVFLKGADFDTAKQALTVNNFNLEQAINYHLERSNAIGAPEDDVAGKRNQITELYNTYIVYLVFDLSET